MKKSPFLYRLSAVGTKIQFHVALSCLWMSDGELYEYSDPKGTSNFYTHVVRKNLGRPLAVGIFTRS